VSEGDSVLRLTLLLPLPWLHTPGQVRIPPHSGCSCPSFEQACGHLPAAAPLTQPQHALPPSRALSGFAHTAGGDLQSCKMQVDIYIVTVDRNARTNRCVRSRSTPLGSSEAGPSTGQGRYYDI
jgi:hypothetical protein